MSTPENPLPLPPTGSDGQGVLLASSGPERRLGAFWQRVDRWTVWASDYLNPILVKETRQALKSRQFVITFSLLLLCGWLWSMMVLSWGPSIYYGGAGQDVFAGYFCILAFPLIVVIPFGAYRSLAAEWEDGTYDLMSISTLNARQIVTGKLGSALLQMIVYLSAIAPCVAFTYLLRGIDVLTINYLLFWLCMNSLVLTFLALALATVTRLRVGQVFVSIVLIAGCLINFWGGILFVVEEMLGRHQAFYFNDSEFWIASLGMLNAALAYCLLFFFVARARLMFPTENRSTALRATMLVQYAMFAGWMGWGWVFEGNYEPFVGVPFLIMTTLHWYLMGMFMTCEGAELSPRVKRGLPQSFLGRVFLTWFNPGSGTGYVFAVVNLAGAALLTGFSLYAVRWWGDVPGWTSYANLTTGVGPPGVNTWYVRQFDAAISLAIVAPCYLIIYLGVGRLIVQLLRRFSDVNMFVGVVFHLGLLAAGNLLPLLVQFGIGMIEGYNFNEYSLLQVFSPVWTFVEVVEHPTSAETGFVQLILPITAILVFALNLPGIADEIRQLRLAKPQRVAEDDLELNPPPAAQPTSPWG